MRWKSTFVIAVGLMAASFVTVYVVLSKYDFSRLKPEIVRAVGDATGRELTLGGDFRFKIGLASTLLMEDVSFQNASWGSRPDMVKVKRVEVQVALIPLLLMRKLEITRFLLVEPDILVETDIYGKYNLVLEKLDHTLAVQSQRGTRSEEWPQIVIIGEIQIEKGNIVFKNGQSGKIHHVIVENLTAVEPTAVDGIGVKCTGSYNGTLFGVSGTVGSWSALTDSDGIWPVKLMIETDDTTASVDGEVRDAMGSEVYTFSANAQGKAIARLAALAGFENVRELGSFKLAAKIEGARTRFTIKEFELDLLKQDLARWEFKGSIKDPLSRGGLAIDFRTNGKELARLGEFFGLPIPILGPFRVSGHVSDIADQRYQVSDFNLSVGGTDIEGSIEANLSGPKPRLSAELSSNQLDLRPFATKAESAKIQPGHNTRATPRERILPPEPLALKVSKAAELKLRYQAHSILAPHLTVNGLTTDLVLHEGSLSANGLKASLGGGTLDGNLKLQPKGSVMGVEAVLTAHKLDVDFIARVFEFSENPGGKLDLDLEVNGNGGSVAEIMAGLNGKTFLVVNNSRIGNRHINRVISNIGSPAFKLANPFRHSSNFTEVNCFSTSFDITDGIARSKALSFDTNLMSGAGEGWINLKNETLDFSFSTSPKEGGDVSGLAEAGLTLGEFAKPFKLTGTLANPTLVIDPAQTALALGKALGDTLWSGPKGSAASLASPPWGRMRDEKTCRTAHIAPK